MQAVGAWSWQVCQGKDWGFKAKRAAGTLQDPKESPRPQLSPPGPAIQALTLKAAARVPRDVSKLVCSQLPGSLRADVLGPRGTMRV